MNGNVVKVRLFAIFGLLLCVERASDRLPKPPPSISLSFHTAGHLSRLPSKPGQGRLPDQAGRQHQDMEEEMVRPQGRLDLLLQNPQGTCLNRPGGWQGRRRVVTQMANRPFFLCCAGSIAQGNDRSREELQALGDDPH